MQTIYIASGNAHKIQEITAMLKPLGLEVKGLKEFKGYESPEETGSTFIANAHIKADALFQRLQTEGINAFVLADDSGLSCEDLDGAPGVYSARYAGPQATDEQNNEKLVQTFRDNLEHQTRAAKFVCAMVLLDPQGQSKEIEACCSGRIVLSPSGKNGFGYDPYFYLEDLDKTMAELSPEEKNKISHRAKALQVLVKEIEKSLS